MNNQNNIPGGYPPQPQYQQSYPTPPAQFYPQSALIPQNYNKALILREINRRIPEHNGSSWSSLEYRPDHIRFATQNKGERVYVLVRRHWFTNVGWLFRNFFYSLLPIVIALILKTFSITTDIVTREHWILLIVSYYSLIVTNLVKEFFDWYFDPYIVTNERILDFDFKPFTSYTINEAQLTNIEDVKQRAVGLIPSLSNYGDVIIRTASETGIIHFKSVPKPTTIRDVVTDLSNIAKNFTHGN